MKDYLGELEVLEVHAEDLLVKGQPLVGDITLEVYGAPDVRMVLGKLCSDITDAESLRDDAVSFHDYEMDSNTKLRAEIAELQEEIDNLRVEVETKESVIDELQEELSTANDMLAGWDV